MIYWYSVPGKANIKRIHMRYSEYKRHKAALMLFADGASSVFWSRLSKIVASSADGQQVNDDNVLELGKTSRDRGVRALVNIRALIF